MPAAAVIPAPIAYIKVVAVKKLVVGSRDAHFKRPCRRVKPAAALALRARSVGAPQRAIGVSTGPPVPSFWIPVPAIELVGTSQGAHRRAGQTARRWVPGAQIVYREKIRVFKAGRSNFLPPNTLAWDNGIGPCPPIFSWFWQRED